MRCELTDSFWQLISDCMKRFSYVWGCRFVILIGWRNFRLSFSCDRFYLKISVRMNKKKRSLTNHTVHVVGRSDRLWPINKKQLFHARTPNSGTNQPTYGQSHSTVLAFHGFHLYNFKSIPDHERTQVLEEAGFQKEPSLARSHTFPSHSCTSQCEPFPLHCLSWKHD